MSDIRAFNISVQLTRDEFESVNADLFESILEPVRAAMEDCNLKPSDIDEIVLVGGSTRIPKVRQVVGSFFGYVVRTEITVSVLELGLFNLLAYALFSEKPQTTALIQS